MSNSVNTFIDKEKVVFQQVIINTSDTELLLRCRSVCKFFQYVVDFRLGLTDAKNTLAKAQDITSQAKTSLIEKLQAYIQQKSSLTGSFQYYVAPFIGSVWKDLTNFSIPNVKQALSVYNSEETQIQSYIKTIESKNVSFTDLFLMSHALNLMDDPDFNRLIKSLNEQADALSRLHNQFSRNVSLHRIQGLFGGKDAFNQLPVFDTSTRSIEGSTGYLNQICFSDLTAPVMRGVDSNGRPFIVIRAHLRDHPKEVTAQVFFQRYRDEGDWSQAPVLGGSILGQIIVFQGYIIDNGGPREKLVKLYTSDGTVEVPGPFKQLADFIKNGGNEKFKLA